MDNKTSKPRDSIKGESSTSKVYYNSACPVCRAGVAAQSRSMEAKGIHNVEWIDVHENPDAVCELGVPLEQVRERLYVKNSEGEIKVGTDAFTELWARTPGQMWLAKAIRLPVLHAITRAAYNAFARYLYRWNIKKKHW